MDLSDDNVKDIVSVHDLEVEDEIIIKDDDSYPNEKNSEEFSDEELDYIDDMDEQSEYYNLSEDSIDEDILEAEIKADDKSECKSEATSSQHDNKNDMPTQHKVREDLLADFRFKTLLLYPVDYNDMKTSLIKEQLNKCSTFGTKFNCITKEDGSISFEGYLELHYLTWDDAFLSEHLLLAVKPNITIRRQSIKNTHDYLSKQVPREKLNPLRESCDTIGALLLIGLPTDIAQETLDKDDQVSDIEKDLMNCLPGAVSVVVPYDDKNMSKGFAYVDYVTREKALNAYTIGVDKLSPAYLTDCRDVMFIDIYKHTRENNEASSAEKTEIENLTTNQRCLMSAKINQLRRDLKKAEAGENVKSECGERISLLEERLHNDQKNKELEKVLVSKYSTNNVTKPSAKRIRISAPEGSTSTQQAPSSSSFKGEGRPVDLRESLNKRAHDGKRGSSASSSSPSSWSTKRLDPQFNSSYRGTSRRGVFNRVGPVSAQHRGHSSRGGGGMGFPDNKSRRLIVGGTVVPESVSQNAEAMKLITTLSNALSEKVQHEFSDRSYESTRRYEGTRRYEIDTHSRPRYQDNFAHHDSFRDSRSRENTTFINQDYSSYKRPSSEYLSTIQRSLISEKINQLKRDLNMSDVGENTKNECRQHISLLTEMLHGDQRKKEHAQVLVRQSVSHIVAKPAANGITTSEVSSNNGKHTPSSYKGDLRESLNKRAQDNNGVASLFSSSWSTNRLEPTLPQRSILSRVGLVTGQHRGQSSRGRGGSSSRGRGGLSLPGVKQRRLNIGGAVVPESVSQNAEAMKLITTLSNALSNNI